MSAMADRAVIDSIAGYHAEIGAAHDRQLPLNANQEKTGTRSYQAMAAPQWGQQEGGQSESPRNERTATTLRNDPQHNPTIPAESVAIIRVLCMDRKNLLLGRAIQAQSYQESPQGVPAFQSENHTQK